MKVKVIIYKCPRNELLQVSKNISLCNDYFEMTIATPHYPGLAHCAGLTDWQADKVCTVDCPPPGPSLLTYYSQLSVVARNISSNL